MKVQQQISYTFLPSATLYYKLYKFHEHTRFNPVYIFNFFEESRAKEIGMKTIKSPHRIKYLLLFLETKVALISIPLIISNKLKYINLFEKKQIFSVKN